MARNSIIDEHGNTPFDYTLRVSQKARYARLQIKPYHGLEVVIPPRFPKSAVPGLVQQHADWIQLQLARHRQHFTKPALPLEIYLPINHSRIPISASQYYGKDYTDSLEKLRNWTRKQAWSLLPAMLEQVSNECGLRYKKISIRSQKTRWGSCSSKGTISLNDQRSEERRVGKECRIIPDNSGNWLKATAPIIDFTKRY